MTMLAIDHLIFGNGFGLASPHCDDRYYWLSGELYHWIDGYGAQLRSFQWRHPKPGETRKLAGLDFRPFYSSRRGPRVDVSWSTKLPNDLNERNAFLADLKDRLGQP